MKKAISIALILLMLLLLSAAAFAAGSQTLVVSANSAVVQPGETATITLTVEANSGFAWLVIRPKCDATVLSWKAKNGDLDLEMDQATNLVWSGDENCTSTGVLVTLTVTVAESAQPGEYPITFAAYECFNADFEDVAVSISTATITVPGNPACSHTDTAEVAEIAPGCDTVGYTAGVICKACGSILSGHQEIPAMGHRYETVVTAPTCEAEGFTSHTCANCGGSYSDSAQPALGHLDENCDHICDRGCGKSDLGAHADAGDDADHLCDYGCGVAVESCSDADGDGDHSCDICGAANVTAHAYGDATCNTVAACTECGASTGAPLAHTAVIDSAVAPTCVESGLTEGKHCAICGEILEAQEETPATGKHVNSQGNWQADGENHWQTCDLCGAAFDQAVHGGGTATCAEKAQCDVCANAYGEVNAQNHSFGAWSVKVAPTDQTAGEETRTCARCGAEESRSLEKLPAEATDSTSYILPIALAILAAAGIIAVILLKKKRSV